MKRGLLITLVAVIAAFTASSANVVVDRGMMAHFEREFDKRIFGYEPSDPFHLLGNTRGFYLEDYGVLFTSELNLVAAAVVTPFRPAYSPEQIEQIRQKKVKRLEDLKRMMRSQMVDVALELKRLPADNRVAVGVNIFRFAWEDSSGIPSQVLMETRRQVLLDFESGKIDSDGLDQAIRMQEF